MIAQVFIISACQKDSPRSEADLLTASECNSTTLVGCSVEEKASINMAGKSLDSSRVKLDFEKLKKDSPLQEKK